MRRWCAEVEGQSLLLRGRDTVDLLQRISTNDVTGLARGERVTTILTSEKGRIVGVMSLQPDAGDGVYSAAVWGRRNPGVANWITKYVIMENVEVLDQTEEMAHILCFEVSDDSEGIHPIPDLPTLQQARIHSERLQGNAWNRLVVPRTELAEVHAALSELSILRMDSDTFERTRIAAGIPIPPNELSEAVNPLEAGLREYVSFRKGCYIGQEVVARLDTYRKVTRILSRVQGSGPAPSPGVLEDQSGELGNLTSATATTGQNWIGLAFLREKAFEVSSNLNLQGRTMAVVDTVGFERAYGSSND